MGYLGPSSQAGIQVSARLDAHEVECIVSDDHCRDDDSTRRRGAGACPCRDLLSWEMVQVWTRRDLNILSSFATGTLNDQRRLDANEVECIQHPIIATQ
jgi:hypothetical protein